MNYFTRKVTVLAAVFAASAMVSVEAQEKSLDIQVSDISCTDASVTITPSDESVGYYWYFRPKTEFDGIGADNIIENQITNWKNNASLYEDMTWQEMMNLNHGVTSTTFRDELYSGLMWDTEYVVYGFGMTPEGEVLAPLNYVGFKTDAPAKSDNTFAVEILSILPDGKRMTTSVSVTPSNDDPYVVYPAEKREVDGYDLTPGSQEEKEFCSMVLTYGEKHTGKAEITFDQQRKDRDYCIVVVGTADGAPTTAPVIVEYRTEEKQPQKNEFILEVSDITTNDCHVKIVPPSEDMLYYWYMPTAAAVEFRGGKETVDIELDRGWYEYVSGLYGGNPSWQELMSNDLSKGTLDGRTTDPGLSDKCPELRWDTDYVLYAYGVNEQCERITDIFFYDFRTAAPEKSDLTFDFKLINVEVDEEYSTSKRTAYRATIDIMPSNIEEQYAFDYCETKYLDEYGEGAIDDYIYDQFRPSCRVVTDAAEVVIPGLRGDKEYYIMAAGWEKGAPTTELFTFKFDCKNVGIDAVDGEKVVVKAVAGGIGITGTFADAAVYGLDGRIMGALRGDGATLSVPAGIYLVKYTEGGKSFTTKVLVK